MKKDSRIYVAGHRGLVGSAILAKLQASGYSQIITRSHDELDLRDQQATREFFAVESPEYVFLAAAFVGGIAANNHYRADFILNNLAIQQSVIYESFRAGVQKLLFLGSSCIYPRFAPQPIKEESLLTGSLEYTNEPYAIAKIAGIKCCESLNVQYGTEFLAAMPTNLYGPFDNFDLDRSHLLPAILRKMHLAKLIRQGDYQAIREDLQRHPIASIDAINPSDSQLREGLAYFGITADNLTLWGTGTPLRELMHSEDMAEAALFIMERVGISDLTGENPALPATNTHINVGTGVEHTIDEIAHLVQGVVGYEGAISFDKTKPDGTPRKLLDVSKINRLGWRAKISLEEGLPKYYEWYLAH